MSVTVSPFPVHNMPVSQGLKLVFPVDNSLQGCYKQRESCVARDFSGEVGFVFFGEEIYIYFFSARPLAHQLLWSVGVWPEVVGFVWQGGGDGNWGGIVIRFFYSDFRPLCFRSIQLCSLASSRQTLKYIVLRSPYIHFPAYSRLFFKNQPCYI